MIHKYRILPKMIRAVAIPAISIKCSIYSVLLESTSNEKSTDTCGPNSAAVHHHDYWTNLRTAWSNMYVYYMNALVHIFDLLLIGCSWAEEEGVKRSFDDDIGRWKSSAVEVPGGGVRTSLLSPEGLMLQV